MVQRNKDGRRLQRRITGTEAAGFEFGGRLRFRIESPGQTFRVSCLGFVWDGLGLRAE